MPTLVEEPLDHITLYYREGTSDKVYQCAIEAAGTRFVVNFAYGRRGSTLNTGTKTNVPVDWDSAKRIYDKLVKEKTSKGYTQGPDGTPYHNSPKAELFTGLLPQLLNPIEEPEMNRLLTSDEHCMQEKFDGRRLLLQKRADQVTGINKKGLAVGLPDSVVQSAQSLCPATCCWMASASGTDFSSSISCPPPPGISGPSPTGNDWWNSTASSPRSSPGPSPWCPRRSRPRRNNASSNN